MLSVRVFYCPEDRVSHAHSSKEMAARKKLNHDDRTREKIRTSQLINRLTDHALGKVEMNSSQVSAALGLIRKTLPDLAAVEMTGQVEQINRISAQPQKYESDEKWADDNRPTTH